LAAAHLSLETTIRLSRGSLRLDVELHAPAGKTLVLLGPNGAGKSTLLEAIAGLIPIESGLLRLDSRLLECPKRKIRVPARKRPIGLMFQGLWLFPHLSVLDNVLYGLRALGTPRHEAIHRVRETLERLDLPHLLQRRPAEISGGEAQRVALARVLVLKPRLLLLDEPLSALDVESRPRTREFLRRALHAFDGPRIVISHDPTEARLLADQLAVLEHGRITQCGPAAEVFEQPHTPWIAAISGVNLLHGVLYRKRGQTCLQASGLHLILEDCPLLPPQRVNATIPAHAITLQPARDVPLPSDTLEGSVHSIIRTGSRFRVHIDSEPALWVEVSPERLRETGLDHGVRVWAQLEPRALRMFPAA